MADEKDIDWGRTVLLVGLLGSMWAFIKGFGRFVRAVVKLVDNLQKLDKLCTNYSDCADKLEELEEKLKESLLVIPKMQLDIEENRDWLVGVNAIMEAHGFCIIRDKRSHHERRAQPRANNPGRRKTDRQPEVHDEET